MGIMENIIMASHLAAPRSASTPASITIEPGTVARRIAAFENHHTPEPTTSVSEPQPRPNPVPAPVDSLSPSARDVPGPL